MCRAWDGVGSAATGATQAELDEGGPRELRGGPEASPLGVEAHRDAGDHLLHERLRVEADLGRARQPQQRSFTTARGFLAQRFGQTELTSHCADQRVGLLDHLRPLLEPGVAEGLHDTAERGHAVALDGREVGPGVERAPIGRAEDRHRPAA